MESVLMSSMDINCEERTVAGLSANPVTWEKFVMVFCGNIFRGIDAKSGLDAGIVNWEAVNVYSLFPPNMVLLMRLKSMPFNTVYDTISIFSILPVYCNAYDILLVFNSMLAILLFHTVLPGFMSSGNVKSDTLYKNPVLSYLNICLSPVIRDVSISGRHFISLNLFDIMKGISSTNIA